MSKKKSKSLDREREKADSNTNANGLNYKPGTCTRITQLDEHAVRLQAKNILKYPCPDACGPPSRPVVVNGENMCFYRLPGWNDNSNREEAEGEDPLRRASRDNERNTSNLPPLPYLGRDEHNPPMQSLPDYVRLAEKIPQTPVIDVDYVDAEFRDADHMTRVYHNMLSGIHAEVEAASKPPKKTPPKKCCSLRKKEPPLPPRWPESDVAESFRAFAGVTNIENSPLEEALTEMGQAYEVMSTMKDDLARNISSHFLQPLKVFIDVDFKDLDLKSKQVYEAAHKIDKMKATGVSKPEMAELKRTFAESRAKTINLFQFVLDSDYSQISKLTDLAECWLGYFREGYRLFDTIIKSYESKTVKIKPKRHKRLCIIPPRPPLAEKPILTPPPPISAAAAAAASDAKHAASGPDQPMASGDPKKGAKKDKQTDPQRVKTTEKALNANVSTSQVRKRHDKQTSVNTPPTTRLFANAPTPRRHRCACPKDQLMFLQATAPPSYFGNGAGEGPPSNDQWPDDANEVEPEGTPATLAKIEIGDETESDEEGSDDGFQIIREPEDMCQCPEPDLEPGFPRWWKRVEEPAKKPDKPKPKEKKEPPPDDNIKLKCRGANHVLDGPCVCESETRIRLKDKADENNKEFRVYRGAREIQTPYAFVRAHPGPNFPGHVGDAVHLVYKNKAKGEYECRLADGTERQTNIGMEYLDVIVDVDNIIKD